MVLEVQKHDVGSFSAPGEDHMMLQPQRKGRRGIQHVQEERG
jgi:hypothetical protein